MPKEPARVGKRLILPPGRIDTWELLVETGREVHSGHWKMETASEASGPEEFRLAYAYCCGEGVSRFAVNGAEELLKYAAEENDEIPSSNSDVRAHLERQHANDLNSLQPYYDRYRAVIDAILMALLDSRIEAEVIHENAVSEPVLAASWRSRLGQRALLQGCAHIRNGNLVDSKNRDEFGYLIFGKGASSVVKASLIASPIGKTQACEDFLFNFMVNDPFGHTTSKELAEMAKCEGVFPSVRLFDDARRAAINKLLATLSDTEKNRVRYNKRGKRPE